MGFPMLTRFLFVVITFAAGTSSIRAAGPTGEQIYTRRCASCHGASGEGTKKYNQPLSGDRSIAQLSKYIARTMPENDPGSCTGEDADKVAAYIHDTFYSQTARERNKPPRVELARLTVSQYRNSIADLIACFGTPGKWDDKQGLRGEYFKSRRFQNNDRVIDRLDAEVKFDFKEGSPDNDKIKPEEFGARWQGSILAPYTGDYEFIVKTENGTRLWVNNTTKPVIDAFVRSGAGTNELRGTVRLLGGRAYPLRLEFFKSKEAKEKRASIALEWKPPVGTAGPIPPRYLSPNRFPETLVIESAFPPDDRSLGWERANTVSKAWDQATTEAALETSAYVMTRLNDLAGIREGSTDAGTKAKEFCQRFAERAFRRPLGAEEKKIFVDKAFEGSKDNEAAVKRVVLFVLKSPRFLYREVSGGPEAYEVAARLSYILWDSGPGDELLAAANAGKLATREQVSAQAEKMLGDPRTRVKINEFFHRWLKLDQIMDVTKDKQKYPDFTPALAADLRTSLDMTLDDVVWGKNPDFRQLLLSDELYLNPELAKFYGAKLPNDTGFQKVKLNPEHRAGVLTHPYLMATLAYTTSSSPIHRGVFLSRGVLGVSLKPPQDAFTPLPEKLHPDLTTRERTALQTKGSNCQMCHSIINPLGFTLEQYDAVGRFRDKDNGKPVDPSGAYETRKGTVEKFKGPRELAKYLSESDEVHTAFATQLFHHLVKQPVRAYGVNKPEELRDFFGKQGYNVQKLVVEIATTAALQRRKPETKTD